MNLKFGILKLVIVGGLLSNFPAFANPTSDLIDPMNSEVSKNKNLSTSSLLERVLEADTEEKKYLGVVGFIDNYGEWLTVNVKGQAPVVLHVISYLLQTDNEDIAANLIRGGVTKGWLSYKFGDGVANDFVFALNGGQLSYLKALFEDAPEGLNSEMMINLSGSTVTPLALLATDEFIGLDFYKEIVSEMLNAGANPELKMENGLTPYSIASSSNNMLFVRVMQDFQESQSKGIKSLEKNTPLISSELIEMQAIADAFIEKPQSEKTQYATEKLHEMWVQMILKGYNIPADLILDELSKRRDFDLDMRINGGLSGMMAASMSPLYGGNVEYLKRLVDKGADPAILIEVPVEKGDTILVNYIQLALRKDNYKAISYLIRLGVNFITIPGSKDVFVLTEAMEQKAYLSAVLIKRAMMSAMKSELITSGTGNDSTK